MATKQRTDEEQPATSGGQTLASSTGSIAADERETYAPILKPVELAALLRIDRRVVYRLLRERKIPGAQKLGRQFRIARDVVLKWLADGQGCVSRSSTRS
jgi:excisionase family DNA binding protein